MQIIHSIRHFLRCPNVVTAPVPMHSPSSPSRLLHSFIASPALARQSFPHIADPNPPVRRASRFSHGPWRTTTICRQGNEYCKPYRRVPISSGKVINILQGAEHRSTIQGMRNINAGNSKKIKNIDTRDTISDVDEYMRSEMDACRTTSEFVDSKHEAWGQILNLTSCKEGQHSGTKDYMTEVVVSDDEEFLRNDFPESSHRDGSIYRNTNLWWKKEFRISDRDETRFEAMMFADSSDCIICEDGFCSNHAPIPMLQFHSIRLSKLRVDSRFIELYGYIAVRDDLDSLLNYVVNISRDDPITLEKGSLIKMTGPKRGICMLDFTLVEYDMRIKIGEHEDDDIPLIDGASLVGPAVTRTRPFIYGIPGYFGAVDITLSRLFDAVEATVEVLISELRGRFNFSLCCLTSGFTEEICLFDGAIVESCGLKRSVVAVMKDSLIDLKFKIGAKSSSFDQYCCSFKGKIHGQDTREIKTDFGLIVVKLTWSALP